MFTRVVRVAQLSKDEVVKLLKFQREVANIINSTAKETDENKIKDIQECLNSYIIDNIYKVDTNIYDVELKD